jgi:subtilisin family serine protease
MPENEMNVTREQGVTGTGIHVAIIDDGLDSTSEDLKDNFVRLAFSPRISILLPGEQGFRS